MLLSFDLLSLSVDARFRSLGTFPGPPVEAKMWVLVLPGLDKFSTLSDSFTLLCGNVSNVAIIIYLWAWHYRGLFGGHCFVFNFFVEGQRVVWRSRVGPFIWR